MVVQGGKVVVVSRVNKPADPDKRLMPTKDDRTETNATETAPAPLARMPNAHERGEDDSDARVRKRHKPASANSPVSRADAFGYGEGQLAAYRHGMPKTQLSEQDRDEQGSARHAAIYIDPAHSYARALGHPPAFAHPLTRPLIHSATCQPTRP
ncbi:uncharacterized protein B0H18DRAFT_1108341 [Fomitopsis serialis]|uniref:uncharacterized protein n=1 Tax=Fomitopsis serialis TaxID=139415 RepID=UPI002007C3A2|nr:uncharacterized protein B0H18DRAFT_1108341 [Neoantrodia serialis]KAH9914444.1 hypothetical protein B0H18DRAFT_1108341 [Neoantrodia serialis]